MICFLIGFSVGVVVSVAIFAVIGGYPKLFKWFSDRKARRQFEKHLSEGDFIKLDDDML